MIQDLAKDKSTVTHMVQDFMKNEPHPSVKFVSNPRQVSRACIKSMVLTQTYPLLDSRFKMKKSNTDICPLCQEGTEDTEHFLVKCRSLKGVRANYSGKITYLLPTELSISLTQALLDSNILMRTHPGEKIDMEQVEKTSRDMIFALHLKRTDMMKI